MNATAMHGTWFQYVPFLLFQTNGTIKQIA